MSESRIVSEDYRLLYDLRFNKSDTLFPGPYRKEALDALDEIAMLRRGMDELRKQLANRDVANNHEESKESSKRPQAVLVLRLPASHGEPDDNEMERIRQKWALLWEGKPLLPIYVMPPGVTCEVMEIPG